MANIKLLILAASAALFVTPVCAGYAQVSPPSGFSTSSSGYTYARASNSSPYNTNTVRTNSSLNIGGKTISVPVGLRVAANAAVYLSPLLFRNPWLVGAAAVGSYFWFNNAWHENLPGPSELKNKYKTDWGVIIQWFDSPEDACIADSGFSLTGSVASTSTPEVYLESGLYYCRYHLRDSYGNYIATSVRRILIDSQPVNTTVKSPVTEPDFNEKVIPNVQPDDLINKVPQSIPLPVDQPVINPDSSNNPQPLRVPQGESIPIPQTNPQQYRQPVIDVVPAPEPSNPWRVDLQPRDIISNSPDPLNSPDPESPSVTTQEKQPGLCDQYPEILACQKLELNTPDIDSIQTRNAEINLTPESGWGSDNAACPAPRHLGGANVDFDFNLVCQFMIGIRPVIISIAWLSAAMILIGFKRGE